MQLQSASGSRKRGSQRGKWWKGTSGRHRQQESFLSSRDWTSFHSNYKQQRQWLCGFVLTILVYMNKKLKISTSCLWLTQLLSLSTKPPCSLSWIFKTHTTSFPSSRVTNGRQLLTPRSDILSISKVSSNWRYCLFLTGTVKHRSHLWCWGEGTPSNEAGAGWVLLLACWGGWI